MVLAVALLLFQFPGLPTAAKPSQVPSAAPTAVVASGALTTTSVVPPATTVGSANNSKAVRDGGRPSSQPVPSVAMASASKTDSLAATAPLADLYLPPPPAFRPPDETPVTHRRWWIVLSATEHSSATFDAWSTRYALLNGRVEADPVMRPFVGSSAIYGAVQVIPVGLDYLARRLQRSSGWTRHVWWVPQSMAAATFLFSGSYNVAHTN